VEGLKPVTFEEGIEMAKLIGAFSYVECTSIEMIVIHVFREAVLWHMHSLRYPNNNPNDHDSKCILQ